MNRTLRRAEIPHPFKRLPCNIDPDPLTLSRFGMVGFEVEEAPVTTCEETAVAIIPSE
jgi:hypothetical protein